MQGCTQRVIWRVLFGLVLLPLRLLAGPGDGISVGSWVLSPYVDLTLTDVSNVYKDRTNAVQDYFMEPEIGIRFSSSSETNRIMVLGNVFYSERMYDQETIRDFRTYGNTLTLNAGYGQRTKLELIQSHRRLDDNDRHASDFESSPMSLEMVEDSNTLDLQRKLDQLGGAISRRFTDKLELGATYRYSGVRYDNKTEDRLDPKDLTVPYGLDLDGHILQLDGGLGLTDKTDVTLSYRHGRQSQESTDGRARLDTLRLGLRSQGADKLVYHAAGGFERYQRPGEFKEDAEIYLSFNFSADWFLTEKITIRAGGFNGTQFSSFYQGNGLEYYQVWAGLGYRWKPSTIFYIRGIYRYDDYLDPVTHLGETKDRHDTRLMANARVDYTAPGNFLRLFLEASYHEVKSNFDFVEYVDQRLSIGANLRY